MEQLRPRKRPRQTTGPTVMYNTGCGHLYITINSDDDGLFEVFAHLGKNGQCGSAQLEAICRSVTAGLRAHIDPMVFVKQFKGIVCSAPVWHEAELITSCADAIGRAIEKEIKGGEHGNIDK